PQSPPETRQFGLRWEAALSREAAFPDGAGLIGDLPVVRLTSPVEESLDVVVLQAFDEAGLADRGVTATLHDLAEEPLEVLLSLVRLRRHVHGVLDRDGTHGLQPPPDFHAKVRWFGRNLV